MSQQLEFPRARRTDPLSSHAAADRAERMGALARQRAEALQAVHDYPGLSTRLLAIATGLDRYMLGRRMPELEAEGLIRRSAEGSGELRCFPLKAAKE